MTDSSSRSSAGATRRRSTSSPPRSPGSPRAPAPAALKPEELRGSTFTVTSAGKLAGLFQTPIVNHPEVAILSIGRIAQRPVVREGELAVAQIGYVSLTFDHRVVDGARAAEFGLAVIRRLADRRPETRRARAGAGLLAISKRRPPYLRLPP